ncbi:hypothetical protein GDO78_009586 [Eleutherodactylus coqui]|uniref:Uncharacterized protein n=1 Tax=Eleutherodactylus coqui TaxID=57060 RepID=A0A8J6FAH8_ELECQ|nr:hypothetical protein GDO78_009586 [Eleutherodactylus coqui]
MPILLMTTYCGVQTYPYKLFYYVTLIYGGFHVGLHFSAIYYSLSSRKTWCQCVSLVKLYCFASYHAAQYQRHLGHENTPLHILTIWVST